MQTLNVLFAAPHSAWGGFLGKLRQRNPEINFSATGAFSIPSLQSIDVLIPTMTRVTQQHFQSADCLKLIQQVGVGLEGVDIDAARDCSILVANVPSGESGNADSVAEMGLYLMLALARDVRSMTRNFSQGIIGAPFGMALKNKTAGIIGLGGLGKALCQRLQSMGMKVHGIKRTNHQQAKKDLSLEWSGGIDQLPQLLSTSDFVILCLPDSTHTHHLINQCTLALMKPTAYLINLGRGGLVERDALYAALVSNSIAGAGLDVFWQEPPDPSDPVFQQNVVVTPHVAGATDISSEGILDVISENLRRLQSGEKILFTQ
ncbi:MAG: phosphoglycerate dehydrogenase-like enzyme [Parasphingorhabdus sp.]|jgi:phosphoglycerate dehydrogenase-like enzyme